MARVEEFGEWAEPADPTVRNRLRIGLAYARTNGPGRQIDRCLIVSRMVNTEALHITFNLASR